MKSKHLLKGEELIINWERLDLGDDAGDGHIYCYGASGESEDGRNWQGTWVECDGEMIEIIDIEEDN